MRNVNYPDTCWESNSAKYDKEKAQMPSSYFSSIVSHKTVNDSLGIYEVQVECTGQQLETDKQIVKEYLITEVLFI